MTAEDDQPQTRYRKLGRRTAQVFDTRTERWEQVGLRREVDRAEVRKSVREAIVLALILIGVLIVFSQRNDLFPGVGKPIRYITAGLLVIIGWSFARAIAKGVAPATFRRLDPATAGSIGFVLRVLTILAVVFGSLAIAGVKPQTLAVGGAFTAVVLGLAAQQSLGNMIAGGLLLSARPFRVGDYVRLAGGAIGGTLEGVVASLGLFYTTLISGDDRILVPNSTLMVIAVIPVAEPDAIELTAHFDAPDVTPARLQSSLEEAISVPLRRAPRVDLEEIDADEGVSLRVVVTPQDSTDGAELASEVLEVIRVGGGEGSGGRRSGPRRASRIDPGTDGGAVD